MSAPRKILKPRTEKQREAARRNGAKSLGPATPEGKAVSSRNRLTHGHYAQQPDPEVEAQIDERRQALFQQYSVELQPEGSDQLAQIDEMADAMARREHARKFQSELVRKARLRFDHLRLTPQELMVRAYTHLMRQGRALSLTMRTDSQQTMRYHRALQNLQRMQASGPEQ